MFKQSCVLLAIALVAAAAPVLSSSRSAFGPKRLAATTKVVTTLPETDAFQAAVSTRGGEMSIQDKAVAGAGAFLVMDTIVRKTFRANKIAIPPQLGGCIILFAAMIFLEMIVPGSGDGIFKALAPGAAFLTKWLPVFFVPGLAMLPLAPSIGTAVDVRSSKRCQ